MSLFNPILDIPKEVSFNFEWNGRNFNKLTKSSVKTEGWIVFNLTLTLSRAWWGRCEKNYLPKEEGREGGEKKRAQRARRARGSNPGPAAC